ncbi:MAG: ion transporter [Burkholderiales bacterium]|nr:ion transporter [Burkholderiales bacterium]
MLTATAPREPGRPDTGWRLRLYTIIFEAETRAGRAFDIALIGLILLSVAVVVLDSVESIHQRHAMLFSTLEWGFTIIFTLEYIARLACVRHPWVYARSAFGLIDLLAVLPTYLAFFFPGLHALLDVRVLRLLRVFRIFKLGAYVAEYGALGRALWLSRRKILVFLSFVLMVVLVMGTLMYVIEGPTNGFTSVPVGVYWAITTMTTVGFGDVTLMAMIGSYLGWQPTLLVFFAAPVAALVVYVPALIFRRHEELPYGPYLCVSALAVLWLWGPIWNWAEPRFEVAWIVPAVLLVGFPLYGVLRSLVLKIRGGAA